MSIPDGGISRYGKFHNVVMLSGMDGALHKSIDYLTRSFRPLGRIFCRFLKLRSNGQSFFLLFLSSLGAESASQSAPDSGRDSASDSPRAVLDI